MKPCPTLEWLADCLSNPPEPRPRNYTRAPRAPKRPSAKNFRVAADYLSGVPIKKIAGKSGTGILYRTVKMFGLEHRRPAQSKALKAFNARRERTA